MTHKLYHQQAKLRAFDARIVARRETERGVAVRLDQTAFYPTSGGQPHDCGTLNEIPVLDVWEEEQDAVWHLLAAPIETPDVSGVIDGERRFDHMQQHTGQHMLSEAFIQRHQAHTVGFHLGRESSSIDLDIPALTWEEAFTIEADVNHIIWENRPVSVQCVTDSELADIPLRKAPQVSGNIRIIRVKDYDTSACGGTHVDHTGEIGLLKITGLERYKGGMRVTFVCGKRALQHYQHTWHTLRQASAQLSVGPEAHLETIARLQEDVKTTRQALKKARNALTLHTAEKLWAASATKNGMRQIVEHWSGRSFAEARSIASYLREQPHTLLLLAVTEQQNLRLVCARSDDLPEINAQVILTQAAASLGGRGGGTPTLAQGGAKPHAHDDVVTALHQAIAKYEETAT